MTDSDAIPDGLAAAMAHRDLASRTNPIVRRRLVATSRVGGIAVGVLGILVIAGWISGVTALTSLKPGLASMKLNTAIGLVLVGCSVVTVDRTERSKLGRLGRIATAGYGLLGLATVLEYSVGRSFGFDNPFGLDKTGRYPGRLATTTALCFVALAVSVLVMRGGRERPAQFAALAVVSAGSVAVTGYAFGVSSLYQVGAYSTMALHTGIALVVAGLAVLCARPDQGIVALVTADTAGGVTVRRMLIPALVGPAIVGGLLDWAARSGDLTAGFRLALFTVAMVLLTTTLVWIIGSSLRHLDLRRAGAEDAFDQVNVALAERGRALELLRSSEERTRRIIDTAHDPFISVDEAGLVQDWNHAAELTFGWQADDALGRPFDELIIPPADRATYRDLLTQIVAGASDALDQPLGVTAVHRDGSEISIELTAWEIDDFGRRTFNAFLRDISARKAAEESIARLAAVVEQSRDAILTLDLAGTILNWNGGAEQIYGYRAEEMIGQKAAILAPLGGDADRDMVRARLDLGQSSGRELSLTRADGRPITVSVTSSPILDASGQLVAVSSISRDISAQKATERALQESEARTRTSLDNMLDGFAILRSVREGGEIVDFEWIYINPAGAATYGRGVQAMIGARLRTVAPGVDASDAFDEYCHVVNSGTPRSKLQMEYKDETVQGIFDLAAWKLDDGFALTWRDVSDREHALAKLQSSEERFRASVEHLHEALSVFTAIRDETGYIVDFRWEFANAAASLITGHSSRDLAGRTLMRLLPDHGPSGMLAIYRDVVETGEPYVEPSLWYEDVWGDGRRSRRAFDVRATKIGDGFVVVTREVTERREQEEELARQRAELERSNREMKLLNQLADMLQSCATVDEAFSAVTQTCAALFTGFSGSISVMDPFRPGLETNGTWGEPIGMKSFAPADCWALRQGRPYLSLPDGPRCAHLTGSTAWRCLCVPMVGQNETIGVVHVMSLVTDDDIEPSGHLGDGPARQLAITVAGQLSMAFANLRLRDSLREMSIRDPLTGLFNRRYLEETLDRELSRAARTATEVGILVIDVDHFKAFNDAHGHEAGDAVLEAVGDVLIRYSRTSDVACRFGGEEFVVILPECTLSDAQLRADELRARIAALRVPYRHAELSGPTISVGVAAFPSHGHSPDDLIRAADNALYTAKAAGRNQVVVAPVDQTDADVLQSAGGP